MIITSKDKIDIEQDFKVEAGPGAGKTEFLVNHIKNVLQNSTRLERTRKIACITYTNTAVETILERLGKSVSGKVEVSTIHSFLYRNVVKPYCFFIPDEYEVCCKKINGHDDFYVSNKFIKEWLENGEFDELKHPNSKKQLLKLPALNQALKSWLLSTKCALRDGKAEFICNNKKAVGIDNKDDKSIRIKASNLQILSDQILELKKNYWRKGRLEHNDVLFFSCILIQACPFILEVLRAKFPYIFVDEYQDTNPIQSFILEQIRKKETIVGVIGDKAQSIYLFQGAVPALFDSFKVDSDCIFTIDENRRSTNQIIKLLNDVRSDIHQDPANNIDDIDAVLYVGDRNAAYNAACGICGETSLQSLSRDNITSNAMKKSVEGVNLNGKLIEQFESADSSGERRRCMLSFVQAIELSINGKYKEALKQIEWVFRTEPDPRKTALASLAKALSAYADFYNGTLMEFYETICSTLDLKLPKFSKGAAKEFYIGNLYKDIAICINIVEDTSSHITIHKAKGSEYKNVLVINDEIKSFLCSPDLQKNEEHRIIYVAISRAQRRLFLNINKLSQKDEGEIKRKYDYINIIRCDQGR